MSSQKINIQKYKIMYQVTVTFDLKNILSIDRAEKKVASLIEKGFFVVAETVTSITLMKG